jgi:hypothetical protein
VTRKKQPAVRDLKRVAERALKAAKELNGLAEVFAETTVNLQDSARALTRLAEEIEQEATKA